MFGLFRSMVERIKSALIAHAAADIEADTAIHNVNRKAVLLTEAKRLEAAGHAELADELRQQASSISTDRPMAAELSAAHYIESSTPEIEAPKGKPTPALEKAKRQSRSV